MTQMARGPIATRDEPGESLAAMVRGSTLLPVQLTDARPRTPEQRLMAAVLEDAVRELLRARPQVFDRRRAEVAAWIRSDDVAWPFSFRNVCEALDLPASRLRGRLARLAPVAQSPLTWRAVAPLS